MHLLHTKACDQNHHQQSTLKNLGSELCAQERRYLKELVTKKDIQGVVWHRRIHCCNNLEKLVQNGLDGAHKICKTGAPFVGAIFNANLRHRRKHDITLWWS